MVQRELFMFIRRRRRELLGLFCCAFCVGVLLPLYTYLHSYSDQGLDSGADDATPLASPTAAADIKEAPPVAPQPPTASLEVPELDSGSHVVDRAMHAEKGAAKEVAWERVSQHGVSPQPDATPAAEAKPAVDPALDTARPPIADQSAGVPHGGRSSPHETIEDLTRSRDVGRFDPKGERPEYSPSDHTGVKGDGSRGIWENHPEKLRTSTQGPNSPVVNTDHSSPDKPANRGRWERREAEIKTVEGGNPNTV
jgi:hypothetical protein